MACYRDSFTFLPYLNKRIVGIKKATYVNKTYGILDPIYNTKFLPVTDIQKLQTNN
jgi:hypothetical protein